VKADNWLSTIIKKAISPVSILDQKMDIVTRCLLSDSVRQGSNWLDLGCGLKPYKKFFDHAFYSGIDVEVSGRSDDLKEPDIYFDGVNIPFEDHFFDGILCTQVLEHVENIELLMAECNRVLKVGGYFIISVPFVYREHEQPHDFRRFTSFGLEKLLSNHSFQLETSSKCLSSIETISTLFCVYLANNIWTKNKIGIFTIGLLVIFPTLFISRLLSAILPDDRDLFCVLVTKSVKTENLKGKRSI